MKLENYQPIFDQIVLKEIVVEQTKGGIYIPSTVISEEDKEYKVVKIGKECKYIQPDDVVKLRFGVRPQEVKIDSTKYLHVREEYIISYERK